MRRFLAGVVALCLAATPVFAQSVQQSGTITPGTVPYWVINGVIGGGVTAVDSPVTSFGVTTAGNAGLCANSARQSSGAWQSLCLGYVSGVPTVSVQNNGSASAQPLQFIVDGTTYAFPGSLANITIGTTPVVGGTDSECLYVSGGKVGQQTCTLSAITSLTGDGTATGPGSAVFTLDTVNSNTGTFGSGAIVPIITVNGKGLITAVTTAPVSLTVGSSGIGSGATNSILYQNGTVLGELGVLGNAVLSTNSGGTPAMSTTLPSALTIPSPTLSGTATFPDAATWTNLGISKAVAISVGSATLPSAGDVSVSGQYQVNGAQIAASNLSNGTTGSGSVVLAASPTISGTWAGSATFSGNLTLSGNDTHSGQAIFTGTSAPSSAAGNSVVMGTIAAPSLANNGQAFIYNTAVNGAVLQGEGSTYDNVLANKSGAVAIGIATGTTVPVMPGLASGTCSSGLGLNASNDVVLVSCPGAASSIQIGTTAITGGTSGDILNVNAGNLGQLAPSNGLSGSSTSLGVQQNIPGGRLTLTSGVPITTTDVTNATVIYYAPLTGEYVPIYNGTLQQLYQFTSSTTDTVGLSVTLGSNWASGSAYDWFIALNGGSPVLCSGPAWSSAAAGSSSRGTGAGTTQLALFDGLYTNAVSITCRTSNTTTITVPANEGTYVGSSLMTAAGATADSAAERYVFNLYNQTMRKLANVTETTPAWAYTLTTYRQANANIANELSMFIGMPGTLLEARVDASGDSSAGGSFLVVGIGINSSTTDSADTHQTTNCSNRCALSASIKSYPGLGLQNYEWIEEASTASGTNNYYGQQTSASSVIYVQSGITGSILD